MAGRSHKVLCLGLREAIALPLIQLFKKENWQVFFMGKDAPAYDDARSYMLDIMEEGAEQVFRVRRPDLLLVGLRALNGPQGAAQLERILALAEKSHTGKIILLSGAEVFAPETDGATEDMTPNPVTREGRALACLEALALAWKHYSRLQLTIVRVPEVYGPGNRTQDGLIGTFFSAIAKGTAMPHWTREYKRDFLAARDLFYGILELQKRQYTDDFLHLSTGRGLTCQEFFQIAAKSIPHLPAELDDASLPYGQAILSPQKAARTLGWQARRFLPETIPLLYNRLQTALAESADQQEKRQKHGWQNRLNEERMPYAENVAGALLMLAFQYVQGNTVSSLTGFDLCYVYIAAMGLLYGRRQALLAVFFSVLIFAQRLFVLDSTLLTLLYLPQHLIHLVSYAFAGMVTAYFKEEQNFKLAAAKWQEKHDREAYHFLRNLFEENVQIKDQLYRQIVNSDDSIGRLYYIIRKLDTAEPENLFTQTAVVTAEILNVENVIIYVVSPNRQYLRQKVRVGQGTLARARSLRVAEYPYLQDVLAGKSIFVNRGLSREAPDLAAPIMYQGSVMAVIQVYDLDFDQWSMYQKNLLAITARLVSSSLARAYTWEQETQARRYVKGTRILKEEEFAKIREEYRKRREIQRDYSIRLLQVEAPQGNYERLDTLLEGNIRAEDFVGLWQGKTWLLLPDSTDATLTLVRERLEKAGIRTGESREIV